jgi:hypothetical protein
VVLALHPDVYTHTFLYLELGKLQLYVVITANEPNTVEWLTVTIESQHWHKVVAKGWELTLWRNVVAMLKFLAFDYIPARYVFPDVYLRAFTSCWFFEYHAASDIDGYHVNLTEPICASVYTSVHMSPELTQGMGSGVDYSDFQYQQAQFQIFESFTGPTDKSNVAGQAKFEPLEGAAGLDNNEVAELVYLQTDVYIEYESEQSDQNVASSTEFRGVVGINLPASPQAELDNRTGGSTTAYEGTDDQFVNSMESVDDRVLENFAVIGSPPFDDETNGGGGNAASNGRLYEKAYRQITGRGPVLDSTDDITINGRLIQDDSILPEVGNVYLSMIWDVAEVSDAGRAFSVPDGM